MGDRMEIPFLSLDQILSIHRRSLAEHGGLDGLRSPGGFEAAAMQPLNDYHYANADIFGIAAAYAYHLVESQAFLDGNKRTALGTALVFLEQFGIDTGADPSVMYDSMIAIANHEMTKADLADLFRRLFDRKPR